MQILPPQSLSQWDQDALLTLPQLMKACQENVQCNDTCYDRPVLMLIVNKVCAEWIVTRVEYVLYLLGGVSIIDVCYMQLKHFILAGWIIGCP